jgi:hypothetical protein
MAANGKAAILTDIINGIDRWRWLVRLARSLAGSLMIDGRQPRRLIVQSRRLESKRCSQATALVAWVTRYAHGKRLSIWLLG